MTTVGSSTRIEFGEMGLEVDDVNVEIDG